MRSSSALPRLRYLLYVIALAVFALPFVYPLIWMLFAPFKPNSEIGRTNPGILPQRWTLEGLQQVFTANPYAHQWLNSLYLSVLITAGTLLFASLAGYAFARVKFWGANAWFLVLLSGMLLPSEVTIIALFRWVSELGLLDSHLPIIVIAIFGPGSTIAIFIFRQAFLSLPQELEDAGRLDGLGRWGLWARLAFPLVRPAIAAVSIITFLRAFNLYFEPLVFLRSPEKFPVALGITRYLDLYGEPLYNAQLGATALAVVPVIIVFIAAQRQFVEGLTQTGIKG